MRKLAKVVGFSFLVLCSTLALADSRTVTLSVSGMT